MELITSTYFDEWLETLKDKQAQKRILLSLTRCEAHEQMLGDIKSVGDRIFELRFHFGAGYRIYYTQIGSLTVFLLAGGDKSSQRKDIELAKKILKEL